MNLTVLMPALNEEKSIGKTIDEIPKKEIEKLDYNVEILIIDGKSTDKNHRNQSKIY